MLSAHLELLGRLVPPIVYPFSRFDLIFSPSNPFCLLVHCPSTTSAVFIVSTVRRNNPTNRPSGMASHRNKAAHFIGQSFGDCFVDSDYLEVCSRQQQHS